MVCLPLGFLLALGLANGRHQQEIRGQESERSGIYLPCSLPVSPQCWQWVHFSQLLSGNPASRALAISGLWHSPLDLSDPWVRMLCLPLVKPAPISVHGPSFSPFNITL